MGRVTEEEAKKYTSSNGSWFQLKNDGDVATVQFVINSVDDLAPYLCHRIKIDDKERYVDCLASYGKECPLCHAGHQQKLVRFVIMYQHEDGQMKIWERGSTFIKSLCAYVERYAPISEKVFQIERKGKPGDMKTQYPIYFMPNINPIDIREIEIPKIMGGVILEKTESELETYLQTGSFPISQDENSQPIQRNTTQPQQYQQVSRREIPVSDRSVF